MRDRGRYISNRRHHARPHVMRRGGGAIRIRALEGTVRRRRNDETADERDVSVTESGERIGENGER